MGLISKFGTRHPETFGLEYMGIETDQSFVRETSLYGQREEFTGLFHVSEFWFVGV